MFINLKNEKRNYFTITCLKNQKRRYRSYQCIKLLIINRMWGIQETKLQFISLQNTKLIGINSKSEMEL